MKKLIVTVLTALMLFGMIACQPVESQPTPAPGDSTPAPQDTAAPSGEPVVDENAQLNDKTLHCALSATPTSLDEGYSTNVLCRQISSHMFETLFTFDESAAVIPQLVDTYTVSDDGLVYDLILRQGITFHDGSDFTADDAIASLERYKTTSTYGGGLNDIAIEKVGDYEIKFTLVTPKALPSLLAFPQRAIMIPKEIAETHMDSELGADALIGTGPYMFSEWVKDVKIVLERFDNYAQDDRYDGPTGFGGKRTAYFKYLELASVTEVESRLAGLETGEFDYADAVPATSYDRINDNPDLTINVIKPGNSIVIEFNHAEGFTADVNFRKALVYAVNPEAVLQAVASGKSDFYRLDPSLYQPEQYYYTEAGSSGIYNSQNLDKVKELLAAANYNGEEIVYLTNKDYAFHYTASMALIEQWQAAGINVVAEFNDWTSQLAKAQTLTGWSINQSSYSPRFDPLQVRSMIHSGTLGSYGFSDAKIDELLDQIIAGGTNEERLAIWEQLQAQIWETLPFVKFGDYLAMDAIRSDLSGYQPFYVARFWLISE